MQVNEIFQWLIGGPLLALGGFVSLFGVIRVAINLANRRRGVDRFVSGVPFVGPVLFSIGWLVSPLEWSWRVLLVVALDFDTLLALFYLPYLVLFRRDVGMPQRVVPPAGTATTLATEGREGGGTSTMTPTEHRAFDWAQFPQPVWNVRDSVAKALATLISLSDERHYGSAYHAILSAVGNNHAGSYFPVVVPVIQALHVVLDRESSLGRRLALEILLDWTTSFGPAPPWGADLERSVREAALALRSSIEAIASSTAATPEERRFAVELADGLAGRGRL